MICKDMQPVHIVEDKGFQQFVSYLQPNYKLPTREVLRNDLIPKLYTHVCTATKTKLSALTSMGLTTDHWTSRSNDPYMAITAHGLTEDFEVLDLCLEVKHMPQSHTAINIADELLTCMENWIPNYQEMKIYVVSDNAANVKAACQSLPAQFNYLPCFTHTLQLVIKDSTSKITGYKNIVQKAKNIVSHFHRSAKSTAMLNNMQKTMNLPQLKLKTECATRWNSTYYMLDRLVRLKKPLNAVLADLPSVTNLTATEWKLVDEYVDTLLPFEQATKIMSATRYPSLSMVIPVLNGIKDAMDEAPLAVIGKAVTANIKERWPN